MTLRIRLFGQLRVDADGGVPTPGWRPRARRLLAYLLLHRRRPLPRARLAFTLWPDQEESEALAILRRALSDLRAGLPPLDRAEWVLTGGGNIQWSPNQPCWLDIDEFERLLGQATPAALHGAVALYDGDLLAEWDDDWLWAERDRLRHLQLSALGQLIAHHRGLDAYASALALARRALELDPLAEPIHRDVIALHYAAGDRAAAIAAYDRLQTLLRDELDVPPMPESQALYNAILRGEPPTKTGVLARPATTARAATATGLIGRESEQAALGALWGQAVSGAGRVIVVSGEAGVGKSRLMLGLVDEVERRGGLALIGHCYEFERALPYQAIVDVVRAAAPLLRHADLPPAHRAALARLAPDLLGALTGPTEPELGAADAREYLFEALLHALFALGRQQPLLVLIEDAHLAAESTLDWLTYCAPRLGANRVLLVITYRAHEVDSTHALVRLGERFGRDDQVTTLALAPLALAAHRALVQHLSGLDEPACAAVADRLFAETAGNPFFLHEVVRGLIETGQLVIADGRWHGPLVASSATVAVAAPESVRAAIAARLARLTAPAQEFLQAAALAGRVFPFELVQMAGAWPASVALEALDEVLARGFVREEPREDALVFAHHLVQEAIVASLPRARRRDWHRRLAEALQALRPDDLEGLAYHFSRAGDLARARTHAVRAGDRAWRLSAPHEAVAHYRTALDGWPETDPAGQAAVLRKLGEGLWLTGALPEAVEAIEAARAVFESLGDRQGAGAAERLLGRVWWERGQRQESLRHYHRALAILEQEPDGAELARAVSAIAQMHMLSSAFDDTIAWGERALALAERLGAADVIVQSLNNLGVARSALGDPEGGLAMMRDSLARALALGLPHDAARAYFNLAELLVGQERHAEARATLEAMLAFVQRAHVAKDGGALVWLAHLEWLAGEWASGLALRRQFLDWASHTPAPRVWHVWAAMVFGRIDNDLGRAASAQRLLEEELAAARGADELQTTPAYLGQLARALTLLGRHNEAEPLVNEMMTWIDAGAFPHRDCVPLVLWACRWYAGQPDARTLAAARACRERLARIAAHFNSRETAGALAEARGLVLLADGASAAAAEQFQVAVAQWAALDRPYDRARALGDLGRALIAAGEATAARAAVAAALDLRAGLSARLGDPDLQRSFQDSELSRQLQATWRVVTALA